MELQNWRMHLLFAPAGREQRPHHRGSSSPPIDRAGLIIVIAQAEANRNRSTIVQTETEMQCTRMIGSMHSSRLGLRRPQQSSCASARRFRIIARDSSEKTVNLVKSVDEEATSVTGDFCAIDSTGKKMAKRTVGEMEQVRDLSDAADERFFTCADTLAGVPGGHGGLLLRGQVHHDRRGV